MPASRPVDPKDSSDAGRLRRVLLVSREARSDGRERGLDQPDRTRHRVAAVVAGRLLDPLDVADQEGLVVLADATVHDGERAVGDLAGVVADRDLLAERVDQDREQHGVHLDGRAVVGEHRVGETLGQEAVERRAHAEHDLHRAAHEAVLVLDLGVEDGDLGVELPDQGGQGLLDGDQAGQLDVGVGAGDDLPAHLLAAVAVGHQPVDDVRADEVVDLGAGGLDGHLVALAVDDSAGVVTQDGVQHGCVLLDGTSNFA